MAGDDPAFRELRTSVLTAEKRIVSPKTYYRLTCRHIEREETLIDHRITWMLTSQGFLFTGFAVLDGSASGSRVVAVIELVGVVIALLSLVGIRAAYLSIDNLMRAWRSRPKEETAAFPPITTRFASALGRLLGYGLPLLFLCAWAYLIVHPS